jgi:SAM-dependent methyltransferase
MKPIPRSRTETNLPFYLEMACRIGGPALELGCGTGRVLLPIAEEGIAIDGVDSSPAMLTQLQRKLAQQSQGIRELVSISPGDLRSYRSERKYPLVIIPFRPLQHMHSVEDQVTALKTAAFRLASDGVLALDVFYPRFESLFSGEEVLELQWTIKNSHTNICRYLRKETVDKIAQNFTATFIYRTYQDGELVSEKTAPLKMSWYTYPHLCSLFLLAGLKIVEKHGSANRRRSITRPQKCSLSCGGTDSDR